MRFAICLLFMLGYSPIASAQSVRAWTQQECFDESNLVAIVSAEAPAKVPNTLQIVTKDKSNARMFQQHETKLRIVSVLKGKNAPKSIVLVHLLPQRGYEGMMGYPSTIRLLESAANHTNDRGTYLVYLSVRDDGKAEPVTGHVDPTQSVRRLDTQPDVIFDEPFTK